MSSTTFRGMPKIFRYSRDVVIQEKIDGTNSGILIGELPDDFPDATLRTSEDIPVLIGSRNRWITPDQDNHGFARWVHENIAELEKLGPGHHLGEWWGSGIQRGYDLKEKRFSLFNTARWEDDQIRPKCCHVVPVIRRGILSDDLIEEALNALILEGSFAAPGYKNPEGIVIFHVPSGYLFKKTILHDEVPKGVIEK